MKRVSAEKRPVCTEKNTHKRRTTRVRFFAQLPIRIEFSEKNRYFFLPPVSIFIFLCGIRSLIDRAKNVEPSIIRISALPRIKIYNL